MKVILQITIFILLIIALISGYKIIKLNEQLDALNQEKMIIERLNQDSLVKLNLELDKKIIETDTIYLTRIKRIYEKNNNVDMLTNDSLFSLFTKYCQDTSYSNRYFQSYKTSIK